MIHNSNKTLVVVGGGAAGFFCALTAKQFNKSLRVIIIEKTSKLLSKVRISGGGRCNVTHACFDIIEMSKRYPRGQHFVKKAFHQFFTSDTIKWFADRGVLLKEEEDGRMFPVTDNSQTIIDCLLREADKLGIEIRMQAEAKAIDGVRKDAGNIAYKIDMVDTRNGQLSQIDCDFICLACGGYPKTMMFSWLVNMGHTIEEPVPSLFTFNMPGNPITKLMGISVERARIKVMGTKLEQTGAVLITHWGMSGPAILKLSAWGARELHSKNWEFGIGVNWIPDFNEPTLKDYLQNHRVAFASNKISNRNPFHLPQRLWEYIIETSGINGDLRWADLPSKIQNVLMRNLIFMEFAVKGKTTFKEEFVTAGGIRLAEVDAHTMMSKKHPGLFFAGEILDVDGITGGFNFQHAWTSGHIAGKTIANS